MKYKVVKFDIEIIDTDNVFANELLEETNPDYEDFIDSISTAFLLREYELYKEYSSNFEVSQSKYYIYKKVENNDTLKVVVMVRISDHYSPDRKDKDGNRVTEREARNRYVRKIGRDIAQQYGQTGGYRSRSINLVFDGKHCKNYEDALRRIEDRLDSIESIS